jgi:hypothetical protein
MAKRGPKPVDMAILRGVAGRWAYFLFALRDGIDGAVFHVEWGPEQRWVLGDKKATVRSPRQIKKASILHADTAWQELVRRLKSDEFHVVEPVPHHTEVWNQLKTARSVGAVRSVASEMRVWVDRCRPPISGAAIFPQVVASHSKELLEARELPSYPRSNRPSSDDKRVEFFAKVLAGLELGIAPATAIKGLHGERFPTESNTEEEMIAKLWMGLLGPIGQIKWDGGKSE